MGELLHNCHEQVAVLFLDIVNFTGLAEEMEPEQLLEELNYCFKKFDQICIDYQLDKIKTIGDAYMAASGFNNEDNEHLVRITEGAIAMRNFINEYAEKRMRKSNIRIQVRIGIHIGPVVAGVVGLNKFQYDIWGDTVNIAARLQQHAEPDQINVSEMVYEVIKNEFRCLPRGRIQAKNKGEMDMYLVQQKQPAHS